MSLSPGIRNLEVAIKRLEAAAGKGQRYCTYCRFALRRSWPDPKQPPPRPADVIKAKCEFCHSAFTVNLTNASEAEREIQRLRYSFRFKDQYTNPKAHAFTAWLYYGRYHDWLQARHMG